MKKKLALLLAIIVTACLVACNKPASKTPSDDKDSEPTSQSGENSPTNGDAAFDYSTDYIDDHLKGDYSIAYKITSKENNGESFEYTVKMMRTSEGYYVSMDKDTELLFIKNGDKYTMYVGDSENGLQPYGDATLTEEDIKSQAQVFLGYMSNYNEFKDELKRDGSETIAGKSCEKYVYNYSAQGSQLKFEYFIDKETGVCMKFFIEGSNQEGSGQYTFECTEFKTSGVTLPQHK
jgi:hypothetical protein